jgi:protoporphyrinogen oxidase
MMAHAAIIGAGMAGLTAAYRLAARGYAVTVFEQEPQAGGLAASFEWRGMTIDRTFHFICAGDAAYLSLLAELGLEGRVGWTRTRMGHFRQGVRHEFGTPLSLLGFRPLPLADRLRFGMSVLAARHGGSVDLDGVSAREWVVAGQGERAYDVIWRPLLEMKFGVRADEVSAAWLRERIRRLATSRPGPLSSERLGFVSGGTAVVTDRLVHEVRSRGGLLRTRSRVDEIIVRDGRVTGVRVGGEVEPADVVVSTVATPLFLGLAARLPDPFGEALRTVDYLGVVSWVVLAKQALTTDLWLNVDDPRVPFPGVVTYTNLDPMPDLRAHLHYVPTYMPPTDPRWSADEDEQRAQVIDGLDALSPRFSDGVLEVCRFRERWAQPVFDVGFGSRLSVAEGPCTPIEGLFRTDMSQTYPHDRSLVNAIAKGTEVADAVGVPRILSQ